MAGMGEREMVKTQLRTLRRGRLFWLDGMKGRVIYRNNCRVRVQLPDEKVTVNGRTFKRKVVTDWSPGTLVEVRT